MGRGGLNGLGRWTSALRKKVASAYVVPQRRPDDERGLRPRPTSISWAAGDAQRSSSISTVSFFRTWRPSSTTTEPDGRTPFPIVVTPPRRAQASFTTPRRRHRGPHPIRWEVLLSTEGGRLLPAPAPIESAATEQKDQHDNYEDQVGIHDLFLSPKPYALDHRRMG